MPIEESGQLKFVKLYGFDKTNSEPGWHTIIGQEEKLQSVSFTKNMDVIYVDGHTNSMMLPKINYKGKTIVFMADLLPSAAHIPLPYVMAYDMFPLTTLNEKKLFLTTAQQNEYVLFFEHDPLIECCTLQMTEKGIRVNETFKLSDL